MKLSGNIKRFLKEDGYGFIVDHDGNSYFFHVNSVLNPSKIEDNLAVEFTPSQNKKGKKAIDIKIRAAIGYEFLYHDNFERNAEKLPPTAKIIKAKPSIISSSESMEAAKKNLFENIKSIGGNGAYDLTYSKSKGEDGNYIYTIHNYSAEPVLIFDLLPSDDLNKIEKSNELKLKIENQFDELYDNKYKPKPQQIDFSEQQNKVLKVCVTIIIIVFFIALLDFVKK